MNILDTFYILFESDASAVKKGTQDAKKSTDELNKSLKQTDDASKNVGNEFLRMLSAAGGALAAGLSVGAITASVMAAANYADQLGKVSEALDTNIEDLSAYADAVKLSGGSNESFIGTLQSMTASLADFATKGSSRAAPFFEELGIKMLDAKGKARDFMDILPELADKFETMTKQESFGIGQKMGLDQGTIMLLQSGRREMDALIARQRELGVVNKEAAETAAKFNDQVDNTAHAFRSIWQAVGSSILPALTSVMSGFEGVGVFFAKHSDFIVGLLIALGSAVAFYVVPPMISAGIAAAVAFAPFLLMGAAIAALSIGFALLYDDIMNFIDGNDSLIGQFLNEFPIIGEVIQGIINYMKMLWDAVGWVFESIMSVIQIAIAGWELLFGTIGNGINQFVSGSSVMQGIVSSLQKAFAVAGGAIGAMWDGLGEKVKIFINLIKAAFDLVGNVAGKISGFLNGAKATLGITGLGEGKNTLSTASNTPLASMSSSAITNSNMTSSRNTSVQTGPITVNTQATDANGIAGAIGNSMDNQMRQAVSNFDDGVLA
jgi:hypothetical protein